MSYFAKFALMLFIFSASFAFAQDDEEFVNVDQEALLKEYLVNSKKTVSFDTTIVFKSEKFEIHLKQYQSKKILSIPAKFYPNIRKSAFKTPEILVDLIVLKDGIEIFKKTIDKSFFADFNNFDSRSTTINQFSFESFKNENFIFSCNVGIPVTDVAFEVNLLLDTNGNISFKE
ncbi:MAG TPA: DUF4738 domain-containing protein [Patescibacteria group bacterium]|nr:DUF4738 domain-containing protein [Patescibacteria group bacterium]